MYFLKKLIISTVVFSILCFPLLTLAACEKGEDGECKTGLRTAGNVLNQAIGKAGMEADLTIAVSMVIQGILVLVGTIFFIMMVYSGILWLSAHGNDTVVEKAKKIITESIIGLAVTLSAYAITYFVSARLGG